MKHYAIIDLETSGGNPRADRITEICIHLFDGEKIIDSFHTLINPEVSIPYNITRITNITNMMVKDAPKFFEVAKRVVEITKDAVFVAHNVRFDYGFMQKEFRNLGFSFSRPQLCTVRLSQELMPNLASYSLGNLCTHLKIYNEQAHRAYGDALATVSLFKHLLSLQEASQIEKIISEQISEVRLPPNLPKEIYENLPDETGVYYMHNQAGEVIYVGKSNEIKTRIRSHCQDAHNKVRGLKMMEEIYDISYELTGSELVALLLENEEIKNLLPKYNRAQRRIKFHYGIFAEPNKYGYLCLTIGRLDGKRQPQASYTVRSSAEAALQRRVEQYNLCENLSGMTTGPGACFQYQIRICKGACVQAESPKSYNLRAEAAIASMNYGKANFFIIAEGRNYDEKAVVAVQNGTYCGYTYIPAQESNQSTDYLMDLIAPKAETPDVLNIIRTYIKKHPKEVRAYDRGNRK